MNQDHRTDTALTNQKGVAAIVVALSLLALFGIAALAIDIGYRNVAKNELQNIADAASLAGASKLGQQYLNEEIYNEESIVAIAQEVAGKNSTGFNIEVQVGTWIDDREPLLFTDDDCNVTKCNAVRVIARRGSDGNPQVPTFFARIWKIIGLDVEKDAVAALTGAQEVVEGDLEIPVGISKDWFTEDFCGKDIQFYPTAGTEGCAGWHVYDTWPANASKLRDDILGGMLEGADPEFKSPEYDLVKDSDGCHSGTDSTDPNYKDLPDCILEFAFVGGNLSTTVDNLSALFAERKDDDGDGDDNKWTTQVVVYDEPCGENPNQTVSIIGFPTVEITGVVGPPPVLNATVICGQIEAGAGGGSYYGTWGSIPNLVEDDNE